MKIRNAKLNKITGVLIVSGLLIALLTLTHPQKIALSLLLAPFALIGLLIFMIGRLLLPKKPENNSVTSRIIPVLTAVLGVIILLLSSLHQLTWRDILLVGGFGLLFMFYISRVGFLRK